MGSTASHINMNFSQKHPSVEKQTYSNAIMINPPLSYVRGCSEILSKAAATRAIFLLAVVMQFFEDVASPARSKNRMCSHPRTGDAIAKKVAEKIAKISMS